jgi:hypothetical protein
VQRFHEKKEIKSETQMHADELCVHPRASALKNLSLQPFCRGPMGDDR